MKEKQILKFPPCFDNAECREAWFTWLEHKKSKRQEYKSIKTQEIALKRLARELGGSPARLVDSIEHSICNNYAGIFEQYKISSKFDNKNMNMPAQNLHASRKVFRASEQEENSPTNIDDETKQKLQQLIKRIK